MTSTQHLMDLKHSTASRCMGARLLLTNEDNIGYNAAGPIDRSVAANNMAEPDEDEQFGARGSRRRVHLKTNFKSHWRARNCGTIALY